MYLNKNNYRQAIKEIKVGRLMPDSILIRITCSLIITIIIHHNSSNFKIKIKAQRAI